MGTQTFGASTNDVSPDFAWNFQDSIISRGVLSREATPEAVRYFAANCKHLSDYGYWYLLGTLWVSYTGWSELALWRSLFMSHRPRRMTSLMKPSELAAYRSLPYKCVVGRAVRKGEADCISYTLDPKAATRFAANRECDSIELFEVYRKDIWALFLRRGESEVIVLNAELVRLINSIPVVKVAEAVLGASA